MIKVYSSLLGVFRWSELSKKLTSVIPKGPILRSFSVDVSCTTRVGAMTVFHWTSLPCISVNEDEMLQNAPSTLHEVAQAPVAAKTTGLHFGESHPISSDHFLTDLSVV
jgi:hypothetical protein